MSELRLRPPKCHFRAFEEQREVGRKRNWSGGWRYSVRRSSGIKPLLHKLAAKVELQNSGPNVI